MGIEAWCECSHHASWHPDGGPCTFLTSRWNHEKQECEDTDRDCRCTHLQLQHVEIF